ncbi:MAG: TIR domain-containing protein [Bacteroidales bacterium]|nr:TIR domain-containing protein [Bacteroidales bacterium]
MRKIADLIEDLLKENGKLSLLLLEAKSFVDQSEDKKLIEFVNNELNGYVDDMPLPDYRIINSEIIGTIQNSFGQLTHKDYPLDFSVVSKEVGTDISKTHIPDGISFVESNIANLTGQIAIRPMPMELVNMLNQVFSYNNPGLNLVSASYRFSKAGIEFVLNKVRQELILGLKRIEVSSESQEVNDIVSLSKSDTSNKVFVTYAWENEEHNDKVISFVDFLRKKGYNASMDRKESQEKTSTNFNQMMIDGLKDSEKIVVVLSPKYKERADELKGGVGFEFGIIMEQLKKTENKYIFVSFGPYDENSVPLAISGRDVLDLKRDQDENDFNELFAKLDSKNIINFSDVSEEKVKVKTKKIKPFKL